MNQADEEHLMDQIRKDSGFLAGHEIMDYSLLLGVHKGESSVNDADSDLSETSITM